MAFIILKTETVGVCPIPELVKDEQGLLLEFDNKKQAKIYVIEHDIDKCIVIDTTDPEAYQHCFMAGTLYFVKKIFDTISDKPEEEESSTNIQTDSIIH